jgi:hypothetical protein
MATIRTVAAAALLALLAVPASSSAQTEPTTKALPATKPAAKAKASPKAASAEPAKGAAPGEGSGGADSTDKLREAAQNPVANLISVPFQNNTNFGYGPYSRTQNVLNIQPVIPFKLTPEWNLITRWVTPVLWQPRLSPVLGGETGLGNIQPSFFLSPAEPGKIIWGVGPVLWLPTATDKTLGVNKWGGGPSAVVLRIDGPWVFGALVNNVWAGTQNQRVNQMLIQPFLNYNLPHGWYLTTSPVITANWLAAQSDRWTVPVGGGVGRLFKVGKLPINAQVQGFYNVVKPDSGPNWTLRFQIQALFPT